MRHVQGMARGLVSLEQCVGEMKLRLGVPIGNTALEVILKYLDFILLAVGDTWNCQTGE